MTDEQLDETARVLANCAWVERHWPEETAERLLVEVQMLRKALRVMEADHGLVPAVLATLREQGAF